MATKWKNKFVIAAWAIMFTFGLSGIVSFVTFGNNYIQRDYFHTSEFQNVLARFTGDLNLFELNNITLEEAKRSIIVTEDEINEHRYRSGYLTDQITNINAQYEDLIQQALVMENQGAADIYLEERDEKIDDIINVFKSDEYVLAKIIKEKEQILEEFYKERENYRPEYLKYKEALYFYFENSATGKFYTNLNESDEESVKNFMTPNNMLYITDYSIPSNYSMYYSFAGFDELENSFIPFEGQIAVSKSLSSSNWAMIEYERYKQKQIIWWMYSLASIVVLILCFYLLKKAKVILAGIEKWRAYYNKVPLDLRVIFFAIIGFFAAIFLIFINEQIFYDIENPFVYGRDIITCMAVGSVLWFLTLVQGKLLTLEFKDRKNVKKVWEKALFYKTGQSIKLLFNKVKRSLKDAFLNTSTGMQLFIVLATVFGLGFAAIMIIADPFFLLIYILLLAFIGLPIIVVLIKSIGHFNRIVNKTNELAVGNLGEDLPVSGKSVLAMLASNINVLKQGVKTSQNEQAKSERLKTELITNVSHDLRTPLTSIITYTELLKTEGISNEDRLDYLEIIDMKSKRLKLLIDDLFEVSKMASGNMELTLEKVDLVQLLQQSLAEYDDTIQESSLQFRITYTDMPVYALVDGKKLWRVFDNLIGNVLKYSLENSRVYITVRRLDTQVMITFKNVSKYELSENIDELFERFKRGDTSRHTEGSGLGLAIAKSIVDIHEGSLDIKTDGDLFKVSISLKLVV
ncbi:HAMP domain-containing histidine kinase [Paenibacillus anaericanus]|uniref:histidine kinase n=1 Tax=Paenibacillus anaericanus TaxID=170367 RepID=A0A3S1K744_9BACL|nr:HAMP domain-containing sensor histidine kinase [Paenibacillus anaericanus]RUT45442.1 HAMP domain-containing histidine kinase [Paenibacillus anaericanus]